MNEEDGLIPTDDIEMAACELSCGQRLMQLHRLHEVAPSDGVMMVGMDVLRFIEKSGMVEPGLYPDLDEGEVGGLSMEWTLRRPSGGFDIITLAVLADRSMRTFLLLDGQVDSEEKENVSMKDVKRFLMDNIPDDDGM